MPADPRIRIDGPRVPGGSFAISRRASSRTVRIAHTLRSAVREVCHDGQLNRTESPTTSAAPRSAISSGRVSLGPRP